MPMLMTLLITLANPTSLPPSISRVFTRRAWKPPFIWLTYGFEWHMARHWRHIQRTYCTYDISNFTSIQRCKEGQESISLGDLSWLVYHQSPSHIMVGISPLYHQLLSSAVDCRLMYCPLVNPSVWHLLSPFNIFVTFLQNWQKLGNWIKRVLLRNLTDSQVLWELTWHSLEGSELTEMSQFARLWHLRNSTSDYRNSITKTPTTLKFRLNIKYRPKPEENLGNQCRPLESVFSAIVV